MLVWEYFKNGGLSPGGGATGACRPVAGRQGPLCKKNNYETLGEVGDRSPMGWGTGRQPIG